MEFREKAPVALTQSQFNEKFDKSIFTNDFLKSMYDSWIDMEHDKCKIGSKSLTDEQAKENVLSYIKSYYGDNDKETVRKALKEEHMYEVYREYTDNFHKTTQEFYDRKSKHEALNDIGVPYNLYNASADDFESGTMEMLFEQKNVLIQGESDTGKSHLSVAFIKYLNKEKNIPLNHMGIFYEERFLTATYDDSIATYEDLVKIPFLILDDLGSMGIGEHKRELIKGAIFERIRENMPTWITTNSTIGSIYDQRTASKIIGEYTIIKKKRTGTRLENKKEIEI